MSRFFLQSLKGEGVTVFGNGSQTRSFCYVSDTVTGLLSLAGKEKLAGEAVNIGSMRETSIIDLASKIIHVSSSNSRVEFRSFPPGDHVRRLPDGKKAKMILDWSPSVELEEGLDRTGRWLRTQG